MSKQEWELPPQAIEQYHYLSMEALEEEERKRLQSFVKTLEIRTPMDVHSYGANIQRELSLIADAILQSTKTRGNDLMAEDIAQLLLILKNFDDKTKELQQDEDNFFEKLLSGLKSKTSKIEGEYVAAAASVDRVIHVLQNHMLELRQSLAAMEDLFESNDKYATQLKLYIIAGKAKLEKLQAKLPEIRLLQKVDGQILDNISNQVMLAIPAWKTQIVITLAASEAAAASKSSGQAADTGNTAIVDINRSLVDTVSGIYEIIKSEKQQRADKEKRLLSYEAELKNTIK
ncbi:MAG: toxic anion resistance protein [Clostridiales bacterium]